MVVVVGSGKSILTYYYCFTAALLTTYYYCKVVVVGSGKSAVDIALHASKNAADSTLLFRHAAIYVCLVLLYQ